MNRKLLTGKVCFTADDFTQKHRVSRSTRLFIPLLLLGMTLTMLAGCAASAANIPAASLADAALPPTINDVIEPIDAYVAPGSKSDSPLPTPTATPESGKQLRITITSQIRANVRSGPGTSFDIVAKANPGLTFDVLGKSEDGGWYQVATNVEGITAIDGQSAENGWVAAELVRIAGEGEAPIVAAPVGSSPLFTPELSAKWDVNWQCDSDRCQIKQCHAEVDAMVNRQPSGGFLPVEHTVTWDDACFSTDSWTFEVNQMTGKERTGEADQNFLYGYWIGAKPGNPIGVFPFNNNEGIEVYCSGPHSVEIEEGGGWTTIYQGNTCHDVNTGMLVYMNYTKRWLYTGDYDGKTYARAFFGDVEKLEQRLVDTNAPLALVLKK